MLHAMRFVAKINSFQRSSHTKWASQAVAYIWCEHKTKQHQLIRRPLRSWHQEAPVNRVYDSMHLLESKSTRGSSVRCRNFPGRNIQSSHWFDICMPKIIVKVVRRGQVLWKHFILSYINYYTMEIWVDIDLFTDIVYLVLFI